MAHSNDADAENGGEKSADRGDEGARGGDDAHPAHPVNPANSPSPEIDDPLEGDLLPILSVSAPPPPSLRDRILAAALPRTFAFVTVDEGPWLPSPAAPVAIKELLADSRDRLSTRLVRFRADGALPEPELGGRRAFYVVKGRVAQMAGGESLGVGAFRDEYPPQEWRGDAGTLVIEFAEHVAGGSVAQSHDSAGATWIDALPGGRVRLLEGGDDGPRSFLVLSMSPGSTLPSHPHTGVEELYVLSGSCTLDGRTLSAGDYHRAAAQSTHPDTHTRDDGCDVLVSLRDPEQLARDAAGV